ncbi:MAG TPA: PRC-barrel domain-containing protein, partial [Paracoccaceae bacterium]|nr:PRC-barrel domain-containing protein [Paracoccaceae bacterium]
ACPAEIDAFTRDYEEAMAAFGGGEALSASEQADLFGLRTTAETAHRAGKSELCMDAIARAQLMLDTAIAPTVLQPRELVGMEVRNAADEYLGEIDGVTLDPMSGRIAYVLVEHGGFLGIGDSLFPVPWRAVTWVPGAEALLLDIDEERLENAPRQVEDETTAQERRAWLLSVHSYYGVEPYWQAGITGMVGAGGAAADAVAPAAGDAEGSGVAAVTTDETQAAQPGTTGDQSGGEASVVVVEPEPGADGQAGAQPSGAGASGGSSGDATAAGGGTTVAPVPVQDNAASGDNGVMDALSARIDELESRVDELSEQGFGQEVRQAIATLETRVHELAESDPGQEVQAVIADLEQRVQALADSAPGEEIQGAVSQLQAQVQELAQSGPGQELRGAVARLEAQFRQLVGSDSATGPAAGFAAGGEPAVGAGETGGAAQAQPDESASGSAATAQSRSDEASSGSVGEPARAQAGATGEPATRVIVIEPEDVQVIEPGEAAAGGQGSGQDTAAAGGGTEPTGAGAAASMQDTAAGGQGEGQETAAAVEGQGAGGDAAAPAEQQSESGLPSSEAGGERQAALAGQSGAVEPCATVIARLEEDLTRAGEMGLAIDEARDELAAAQAMLSRDSEALCRAAVKRAEDDLAAQGFEPAQGN